MGEGDEMSVQVAEQTIESARNGCPLRGLGLHCFYRQGRIEGTSFRKIALLTETKSRMDFRNLPPPGSYKEFFRRLNG